MVAFPSNYLATTTLSPIFSYLINAIIIVVKRFIFNAKSPAQSGAF
jgi:hypothetical protein